MKSIFAALAGVMLLSFSASAIIIHVPGDYPNIQAGINAATNGDTVLVADGTYTGTGDKNLDFAGKEIVVISENGPVNCIIDCQNSGRGIYFDSYETNSTVFAGFTIRNGNSSYGGGINITSSSPTIKRCIIWSNSGSYGGGIYVAYGDPNIIHCTIAQNSASRGGAMYSTSSNMIVNSCIVTGNTASG